MFSPEYIKLCTQPEVADRLREEWEPKFGDWVKTRHGIGLVCEIVQSTTMLVRERPVYRVAYEIGGENFPFKEDMIPLFQPRQLIEMLEERGYALAHLGDERCEPDFEGRKWNPEEPYMALAQKEPGDYVKGTGPDPETALLRAWLEVVKDG